MQIATPDRTQCDRARLARDARFDGLFLTAVRSTGIYCRPVCPAPPPKPANVGDYPTAAAASAAGYRPCLRCRPELSPQAQQHLGEESVQRALAMIADGALQEQPVQTLSDAVGLSARQLQQQFVQQLGATPIQVHGTHRLLLAKQLLTETALPVTEVALAAGFNSLRRFNAAFLQGCGMPPSALRKQRAEVPGGELTLRLGYRPPLDLPAMLAFLQRRAIPGIEQVDASGDRRVTGPPGKASVIGVSAAPQRAELLLRIGATDPRQIPQSVRRVRRLFDLDADLQAVPATLAPDPLLAEAIARRPGLRVPGGWDGFEVAVCAVLGQQISAAGTATLAARLVDPHGGHHADMPPGLDRSFPTPDQLADAPLEQLGLPRAGAATLRALASACAQGQLHCGAGQRLPDFLAACTALPGIGPWTAHYLAMRALSHPDAFPAGDLILQQVLGAPERLSARATDARSQAWRPWCAYAVLHLWHLANDRKDTRA